MMFAEVLPQMFKASTVKFMWLCQTFRKFSAQLLCTNIDNRAQGYFEKRPIYHSTIAIMAAVMIKECPPVFTKHLKKPLCSTQCMSTSD